MKKILIVLVVVILIGAIGFGGWYLFLKKNGEGGSCANDSKCQEGLKCINKICSSGKAGSACDQKSDCKTQFCVSGKCTEGKAGDTCVTYKECAEGLFCQKSICAAPPNYSKYFSKVIISKMKTGMPPGPNNVPVESTVFSATDGIEVDFRGVKPTTVGNYYYEFVDAVSGEVVISSKDRQELNFAGGDTGFGTDLVILKAGTYDLNIYFNNELVFSSPIVISQ